jgi:hypothetical protein
VRASASPEETHALSCRTITAYETRYASRDVVYLLGARDNDPDHARSHWYYAADAGQTRGGFVHHLHDIPGVGRDDAGMLRCA